MKHQSEFERLISALQPWLTNVVIIGGWAHRLHQAHPLAQSLGHDPVYTRDADVAFNTQARLKGQIADALNKAGFIETLSSDETPPVAQYQFGEEDQGFYAEFLTPLTGSGIRRDGSADATIQRAGIIAQKLRHLEVLLVAPWHCPVGGGEPSVLTTPVEVAVANPVSFVAQKLLIHASRLPSKRAQDILYIHDTIQLFGGSLKQLNVLWCTEVRPSLTRNQNASIRDLRQRLFATVTDTIRDAARIPVNRRMRAEEMRQVCELGLAAILSGD
jgi:hypothetical protein